MPSQFYGTPLLPAPMQECQRSLKLGDPRKLKPTEWGTSYNDDYNTSVRIPFSVETLGPQATRAPHQYTTGYVLTSISRQTVQEIREQLLPHGGIQAAKKAAAIFKEADPKKLGIMSQPDFMMCISRVGIHLTKQELMIMMHQFRVKDGVMTAKAVDYIDFLCNVVPEAFN